MFAEGFEEPVFVSIDDPVLSLACRQWQENEINLLAYKEKGARWVLLGQEPETGCYIVLRAKEFEGMEKATYWKIRQAKEKLQSAFFDMDDAPKNMRDEIKIMGKRLEEIEKEVNELVG